MRLTLTVGIAVGTHKAHLGAAGYNSLAVEVVAVLIVVTVPVVMVVVVVVSVLMVVRGRTTNTTTRTQSQRHLKVQFRVTQFPLQMSTRVRLTPGTVSFPGDCLLRPSPIDAVCQSHA